MRNFPLFTGARFVFTILFQGRSLQEEGYRATQITVTLDHKRVRQSEYQRFEGLKCEIRLTSILVLSVGMGFPFIEVYLLLGLFAVAYTTLGGIQADVYSDAIQFVVLWLSTLVAMVVAWSLLGEGLALMSLVDPAGRDPEPSGKAKALSGRLRRNGRSRF